MPLDETEAVVLKTSPCAEQDKIVVLFSRERGVLRGVAKGARKFGNRFGASLEPLSIVRAFFYEKERRELITISNCDLLESFFDAQRDPWVAGVAAFFAELIEEFSPPQARDEDLYRLLTTVLRALAAGGDPAFLTAYYEVWFLRLNGLLPNLSRCRACRKPLAAGWLAPRRDGAFCGACAPVKKDELPAEAAAFLAWAKRNSPLRTAEHPFTPEELRRVRKALEAMIVFHLEREPKSLRFLDLAPRPAAAKRPEPD